MDKLNILVVEDGQSQREMLKDFFSKEGHMVAGAEDGNTAIEQVQGGHFDLLLLDFKMPGMNGIEVLKKIKDINPEISVVMMTAYGTIETAVDAMKLGAVDYISKPIDLDDLSLLVGRIAERQNPYKRKRDTPQKTVEERNGVGTDYL